MMYNRYIPQPDGSYQRNRLPDAPPNPPASAPVRPAEPPEKPPVRPEEVPLRRRPSAPVSAPRAPRPRPAPRPEEGLLPFLRQLLPRNFGTGDLVVILLLLLMSNDAAEDRNTPLLTLALYLFL